MSATQTRISHKNLPEQVLIKFANSPTAKAAVGSDTLPRSGYARSDNENQSTALPWSFASSFFYLRRALRDTHAYTSLN